jgi:hypothetical protein
MIWKIICIFRAIIRIGTIHYETTDKHRFTRIEKKMQDSLYKIVNIVGFHCFNPT